MDLDINWELYPDGYTLAEEDIQYFQAKLNRVISRQDRLIATITETFGYDPKLLEQKLQEVKAIFQLERQKAEQQLNLVKDTLTIYKLSRSDTNGKA